MKTKLLISAFFLATATFMLLTFSYAQTIGGGCSHSLAVCSDKTVRAWGNNADGQLGNGNTINSYVPVQVSGLTDIIAIAGGGDHSLAMKSNGTVWAGEPMALVNLGMETTQVVIFPCW